GNRVGYDRGTIVVVCVLSIGTRSGHFTHHFNGAGGPFVGGAALDGRDLDCTRCRGWRRRRRCRLWLSRSKLGGETGLDTPAIARLFPLIHGDPLPGGWSGKYFPIET